MKNIPIILAGFSVTTCLVLLYFLLTTDLFIDRLYGTKRQIMVLVLVAYSAYRLFRVYKLIKK